MDLLKKDIEINKKIFPARIHVGDNPKYVFITNHGMLSNNTSFRYFEKWLGEDGIVVNYDIRTNGQNKMRSSRMAGTYVRDLRDVIKWTKNKYKNLPIITIGSSLGASIVLAYAKKYGNKDVYKHIAWSIPYNFVSGEEAVETANKTKKEIAENEKAKFKEPTKFSWAMKFFIMIFTNYNAKAYVKINLERTADNKTLKRINRMNKPKATPVKLFYASGKLIFCSNRYMKKINKRENNQALYFQSTKDSYLTNKNLKKIKNNTGTGVKLILMNKGKHAFQWENENGLNIKVFEDIKKFINKK